MFLIHIIPTKHAEQEEIDTKWLGKKLAIWRESWRVGKNIIIANKSIKETENLIFFFQCKIEFYFAHEHHNRYFHEWKILLVVFIRWNKIRSYIEKLKYPLFSYMLSAEKQRFLNKINHENNKSDINTSDDISLFLFSPYKKTEFSSILG